MITLILLDGDISTTKSTSLLLIEGDASINIDTLQDLLFLSLNTSSSQSSEINLFGKGTNQNYQQRNTKDVDIKVKDFNNVKFNIFADSVLSLPIVVSVVSRFEINDGGSFRIFKEDNANNDEDTISIKTIIAPTKTKNLTSYISSNSKLNIKYASAQDI